jgi:sulfite reductase beta subunit-like hemoprotein
MSEDGAYIEKNDHERARMRELIERLSDHQLREKVNEHWTVAGVLAHIAFWDARSAWLASKIERGIPFTAADVEPDDVTWINDSTRGLIHAIAPREAARFALAQAEETDARVAALQPSQMWPANKQSLLNAFRSEHRAEHLDQIEAALGTRRA